MTQTYPRPDRSNITRNFVKTPDNEALDLGWTEGTFRNGRPYRAEYWAEGGVSMMTVFFSTLGVESYLKEDFVRLLEQELGLTFKSPQKTYLDARRFTDPSGNDMWSVNLVVGDEGGTFIAGGPRFNGYPKSAA